MQVVACQLDIQWENPEANFDRARELLSTVEIRPGALVILPEMFSTGFSMDVEKVAEGEDSAAESFLRETALDLKSTVLGGLVFPQPDGQGRNELVVYGPDGEVIGRYQKNHTFSYTRESDFYDRGTEILLFDWAGFRVCPTICYDLRFPELYRRGVAAGANLFPVIANWPALRADHWLTLLRARAIENQAIVIGVNRCGQDPSHVYSGDSIIADEQGRILANAGDAEVAIEATLSLDSMQAWRTEFKALADMQS